MEDEIYVENDSVTSSARGSVAAMFTLGIFDGDVDSFDGTEAVTRANAAEYFYRIDKSKG